MKSEYPVVWSWIRIIMVFNEYELILMGSALDYVYVVMSNRIIRKKLYIIIIIIIITPSQKYR